MLLPVLLAAFTAFEVAIQAVTTLGVIARLRRNGPSSGITGRPGVSILRPVCGIENHIEETLASTFTDAYPTYEILFCCAREDDPIVPVVRRLIAAHPEVDARLLIGDDRPCGNPKLNNLVKGWQAAKYNWILMADSNVLLPSHYITCLLRHWTPGTGLVTSPPAGIRADGPWAELEAAFLNTYQDRMQLFADEAGQGFAQGKILFWRSDVLAAAGGLVKLGMEMAEDVASTKAVRAQGLHVRVLTAPWPQPLGHRSLASVWDRQVRWARVRRLGFPAIFALEILSGAVAPVLAATLLAALGMIPGPLVVLLIIGWYGLEWALAHMAGWPRSPRDVAMWALRDLMIPVLWVMGWAGSSFEWRGNVMTTDQIIGDATGDRPG
jgi:ceramide glucosyltransferase